MGYQNPSMRAIFLLVPLSLDLLVGGIFLTQGMDTAFNEYCLLATDFAIFKNKNQKHVQQNIYGGSKTQVIVLPTLEQP